MKLVRSNRTEALADALASQVRAEPLPPIQKEVVVVQSQGMERWLGLALAKRLGVWANPWFPFPRTLIEWVLEKLDSGPSEEAKSYERRRLKWTIAELLRASPPDALRSYLPESNDDDRSLRLATSVASVFDEYVMYRPALLSRWAEGEEDGWQPELWRRVVDELGPHDLSTRIERGIEALARVPAETIPLERLHLFSPETLPPLFLHFLTALGRVVPTTLYSLEPSSEYLGDVASKAERAADEAGTLDGHPFLMDVGRLSRDFQQLLHTVDGRVDEEVSAFIEPGGTSLLQQVQNDILRFRSPPPRLERRVVDPSDPSISIHACTSPMREAQVLHDLVCGALEDDPSLRPEDIVVMTPDLEAYAPAFRAVFGEREPHRIPYEVHDRRTREDATFYDDFLTVLEVLDSRFSVLDVMRLMDARSMRAELHFTEGERARLADLLEAAGVRWGIDAMHRAELDFPEEPLHTWRAGLDRLLLGFAATPDSVDVFQGLLPRGAPSLEDAELTARLARLCEILFDAHRTTRQPLSLEAWSRELGQLCELLFAGEDEASEAARTLREALAGLGKLAEEEGFAGAVSLETFRRELRDWLVRETPAVGFLRRGVTLTELVPLRSVPFQVVCLVGMSEDAFPRADDRPSFDLTRDAHVLGDRNKRDDDRHSFLQAVLCARERLIVTYSAPGQSLRTDPNPSPVVWELHEAAQAYYRAREGELLDPLVHPLHAFDREYFSSSALPRSFSRRFADIATEVSRPSRETPRIALEAPPEELTESISVGELTGWLWNPSRAFIDQTLRARFDTKELYEPTDALTELTPLGDSKLGNEALRAGVHGAVLEELLAASPELPDGTSGALERERLLAELESLAAHERELRRGETPSAELLEIEVDGLVVEARMDGLLAGRRLVTRFTKTERRAELATWIEHLLMLCAGGPHRVRTDLLLRGTRSKPTLVAFGPVKDAREELERLVRLYRRSRTRPVPLFERASRELASAVVAGKDNFRKKAADKLSDQRRWDPRMHYLFGESDPFDDEAWAAEFEEVALALYRPLLEHRSES